MNISSENEKGFIESTALYILLGSLLLFWKGPSFLDNIPFFKSKKPQVPEKSTLLKEYERQAAQYVHDYTVLIEKIPVELTGISRRQRKLAVELSYRVIIAVGGAPIQKIEVKDLKSAEKLKKRLEKYQIHFNKEVQRWIREVKKLEAEKTVLGKAIDGLWYNFKVVIILCIVLAIAFPSIFGVLISRIKGVFKKTVDAVEVAKETGSYKDFIHEMQKNLDKKEKKLINKFENSMILK